MYHMETKRTEQWGPEVEKDFHGLLLAPPAEWQRSFSNADLSVVVHRRPSSSSTFHFKIVFLKKNI